VREVGLWLDEGGADSEVKKNGGGAMGRAFALTVRTHCEMLHDCVPTPDIVVLRLHGAISMQI
jgi:hypothetical protein